MIRKQIEVWLNSDKKIQNLISVIEKSGRNPTEKAKIAFEKLSSEYKIPVMPYDIDEHNQDSGNHKMGRSLFEEHALVKFLSDKNEDPRSLVLIAIFNLLNNYVVDYKEVVRKEFGQNFPNKCRIAIAGEGYYGTVVFPNKESKSWIELGCKLMRQLN